MSTSRAATPAKRRLGLGGPRLGGGPVQAQSPSKRLRFSQANEETTAKVTRAASAATFHGWKDVDLIVRSNVIEEDDDLNEGFCHYSIIDDKRPWKTSSFPMKLRQN